MSGPESRWGGVLCRWIPLVYILPIVYLLQTIFWTPIDQRFYNYFHSKRSIPGWTETVVVGIDRATLESVFQRPFYPLSRHVKAHSEITKKLVEAGARAVVFDLALSDDTFDGLPDELARAFESAGNVFLVMSMREERRIAETGETTVVLRARSPAPELVAASNGAFLADVQADPDGVVRRFEPDPGLERMGLETLPEHLARFRVEESVPIEFPSIKEPLPIVSYAGVLRDSSVARPLLYGRIAFVGHVEPGSADLVVVPRPQSLEPGVETFELPGVVVLAAVTETLLRGAPIRDAGLLATLAWNVLWCLLAVTLISRRHPGLAALVLGLVITVSLAVTGVLHVQLSVVFPAGLLFGCVLFSGAHALISSYMRTANELKEEELENERVRQQMETARRTQEGFLPAEIPRVEGLDLWGVNVSSETVSGDYYDVLDLGESGPLILAIADVSGKGLPAALLMSNVQAGLHCHAFQKHFDITMTVENLNRLVSQNTGDTSFVTLFLAEIDKPTRRLRYVRAGHDVPILMSGDGSARQLEEGGLVLGFAAGMEYSASDVDLEDGDVLCLYTDGVTEARNPPGEEFGLEKLVGVVRENRERTAPEIGEAILRAVEEFSQRSSQADDVTLVILKIIPNP